jgi:hypothetical protein
MSLAIVIAGMICTWRIGMVANRYDHELDHASDYVQDLRSEVKMLEKEKR